MCTFIMLLISLPFSCFKRLMNGFTFLIIIFKQFFFGSKILVPWTSIFLVLCLLLEPLLNLCHGCSFTFKVKNGGNCDDGETKEITVYDYFTNFRNIHLTYSAYMPCLDVGKPKRPNYLPLEVCILLCTL